MSPRIGLFFFFTVWYSEAVKQYAKKASLERIAAQVRKDILVSTTAAGSGHPTSSLSSVELLVELFFGGTFRADLTRPAYPDNDRLLFSKGHAAPLLYALYAAAGKVSEKELKTLRHFGSRLEGHPAMVFPYTEAPTGSLGQGLALGLGMALAGRMEKRNFRTYVLVGDGELAEGSVWEAAQIAGKKKTDHLVAIIDVNRLGQSGATMFGHGTRSIATRFRAFGWQSIEIGGHDLVQIHRAYRTAEKQKGKPTAIIAKTMKGKGVSFLENRNGWHGKALSKPELVRALSELHAPEKRFVAPVSAPRGVPRVKKTLRPTLLKKRAGKRESPREAFGRALVSLAPRFPNLAVLDGDVKNSTFTDFFAHAYPDHFLEMYIGEQTIVGAAGGLALRGELPVAATFSAFLTRAFDQLRMLQHAKLHAVFVGTHAGVSVGQDGPSQMGLEDIALFRTLHDSIILYPADGSATAGLLRVALSAPGIVYLRLGRNAAPTVYPRAHSFRVGGSNTIMTSKKDHVTLVGCGVTVHEAIVASRELQKQGINARVIDVYSIKPLDAITLKKAARETKQLIVAEDHVPEGGVAEAIRSVLGTDGGKVFSLAVMTRPKSGRPDQLLRHEHIDAAAIIRATKKVLRRDADRS